MSSKDWRYEVLGEIIDLVIDYRGKTPKKLGSNWSNSGYRALSAKNIKTGKIVQEENIRFVDENLYKKWMKDEINYGDILITSEAPFGEVFYWNTDEKIVLSQRLFGVRINKEHHSKYIYYYMISEAFQNELKNRATGTTVIGLRQPELLKCRVKLPHIPEQKVIANTLSCVDDMIEINNRTNQVLEEMGQAIFKRWFIDFEFPNEEGEPYKSSGGEMVDSEMGEIPKGWKVEKAGDIFNISIGKTPPRKEAQWFTENNIDMKWVSISDMGASGVYIMNSSEYLTKEAIDNFNIKMVPENTVLLSFKLTVGRVAITNELMATNEAIAHFVTDDHKTTEYLYLYLKQFNFETMGNTSSIATAINSKVVRTIPIITMDINTLERFYSIMKPIFKKIRINQKESATLVSIRDTLLPKLMSGEIRVPIEEVV